MAAVLINGAWGYIHQNGEMMIEPTFQLALDFKFDHAIVKKDGKWGMINKAGKYTIESKYKNIEGPIPWMIQNIILM